MKWINYRINNPGSTGQAQLFLKSIPYSEANLDIARQEAYGGQYTVEDDGLPEQVSDEDRIAQLEDALELLLSGVTE